MFNMILAFMHYLCRWLFFVGIFLLFRNWLLNILTCWCIYSWIQECNKGKSRYMRSGMYNFTLQKKGQVVDNNKVILSN